MNRNRNLNQLIKYFAVGGVAFTVEYVSFLLITSALSNKQIFVAQTVSFCLGLSVSFIGSRIFTFKRDDVSYIYSKRAQFLSYISLAILNLFVTNVLIYVLTEQADVPSWLAKIATMLSVVVWNYIVFNKFIFKRSN